MPKLTISMGGKTLEISQLTIRQMRDLRVGDVVLPTEGEPKVFWDELYDLCVRTIAVAVREAHSDLTEEALWKLPATEDELGRARREILLFAGLRAPDPTIAELRATIISKEKELEALRKTLAEREEKAKLTGE